MKKSILDRAELIVGKSMDEAAFWLHLLERCTDGGASSLSGTRSACSNPDS